MFSDHSDSRYHPTRIIYRAKLKIAYLMSGSIPKWSSLKGLGTSRAVSLTVFVPFIGSFIIFNNAIYGRLELIPQISKSIGDNYFYDISLTGRLYLLYVGLSLVGVASFLFSIFCPPLIKKHLTSGSYISEEKNQVTKPKLIVIIIDVANFYHKYAPYHNTKIQLWKHIAYDPRLTTFAYSTFSDIASRVTKEIGEISIEGEEDGFYTYRGHYIVLEKWMALVSGPPTALRRMSESFFEHAQQNVVDVMTLHHMVDDTLRPPLRLCIALLYFIGFSMLAIPTILTFSKLIYSLYL